MKPGIIAIIQARVGSKRLPGKVLLPLKNKTVLEHVVERVNNSRLVREVVVATTVLKEDLRIVRLCSSKGISVYCGSENDVLDRYFQAARLFKADQIARITADCPLIDPNVIDKVIRAHLSGGADYTTNTLETTFPDGQDVEIFTFRALEEAWGKARLSSEREHVTPYIRKNPDSFKLANIKCRKDFSQKRWTLDEKEDYKFIRIIYEYLYNKDKIFGMEEIIKFMEKHPEYEKINSKIKRNEGYQNSLESDRVVFLAQGL